MLIFPIQTGTNLGSVQIAIPAGNVVPVVLNFLCQFLITFRAVNSQLLTATVEGNGVIATYTPNVSLTANYSPGPHSAPIGFNMVTGAVDVKVTTPIPGPSVSFDECVIEYLMGPVPPPP
jgi:hypothetical protein